MTNEGCSVCVSPSLLEPHVLESSSMIVIVSFFFAFYSLSLNSIGLILAHYIHERDFILHDDILHAVI